MPEQKQVNKIKKEQLDIFHCMLHKYIAYEK